LMIQNLGNASMIDLFWELPTFEENLVIYRGKWFEIAFLVFLWKFVNNCRTLMILLPECEHFTRIQPTSDNITRTLQVLYVKSTCFVEW
jgi:F0F1-type ATP synthase membrane subunit a